MEFGVLFFVFLEVCNRGGMRRYDGRKLAVLTLLLSSCIIMIVGLSFYYFLTGIAGGIQ